MAGISFADRLWAAVQARRTPVLVGLDPRWEQLPDPLKSAGNHASYADKARAYTTFCKGVIDAVAPLVPAVKPQAAFFEQLGPAGMVALGEVISHARERGLIVITDGKRNDIGSTATAYAEAYLGSDTAPQSANHSPWGSDALTVSPYLGDDSLTPFVEIAQQRAAGIFVLVKTSNPGGKTFQDLITSNRALYLHVAELVERLASETCVADSASKYGAVGAVVGATYPAQLEELRSAMPHTWFLVPGFGAQGGTAADVAAAFDERGAGAIINNSRGIIFAHARKEYAQKFGDNNWQGAVEAATLEMIERLRAETPAGRL